MILDSNLHISQELITMLAEKTTQYYKLLEVHNKCTEDMKKNHNVSKCDKILQLHIFKNNLHFFCCLLLLDLLNFHITLLQNITKSFLGGLKAVSWDFSPGNQCKIKRDAFFNLNELNIENLNVCKKPEFIKPTKLEECMVSGVLSLLNVKMLIDM